MDKSTPYSPKPLVNATCKLGKKGCFEDGRCHALGDCENKIVTNADRIRAMSIEELAEIIMCPWGSEPDLCCTKGTCLDCCEKWLRQQAEETE